eukprot:gene5597-5566_t
MPREARRRQDGEPLGEQGDSFVQQESIEPHRDGLGAALEVINSMSNKREGPNSAEDGSDSIELGVNSAQ